MIERCFSKLIALATKPFALAPELSFSEQTRLLDTHETRMRTCAGCHVIAGRLHSIVTRVV